MIEAVESAWEQASAATSRTEKFFGVAGRVIRMRCAGPAIDSALTPALAHIACEKVDTPDLTICCWDDESSGVRTPEPQSSITESGLDFLDGPVRITWEPSRRVLTFFDSRRSFGLMRFPDTESSTIWESAAPARRLLHWWAGGFDMQLAHAAAVGTHEGGVLLAGRGGSGKSTTALACIGTSLGYLADDYCLLSCDAHAFVHSIYSTGKADAASVARLPRLADSFARAPIREDGKRVIFGAGSFPASLVAECPLRAVVVPRTGAAATRLRRITSGEALRMLAPSTMMQLPGDRPETLARLARVVRALPCYELALSSDPDSAIPYLEQLTRTGEIH